MPLGIINIIINGGQKVNSDIWFEVLNCFFLILRPHKSLKKSVLFLNRPILFFTARYLLKFGSHQSNTRKPTTRWGKCEKRRHSSQRDCHTRYHMFWKTLLCTPMHPRLGRNNNTTITICIKRRRRQVRLSPVLWVKQQKYLLAYKTENDAL